MLALVEAVALIEPMQTEDSTDGLEDVSAGNVGREEQDAKDDY